MESMSHYENTPHDWTHFFYMNAHTLDLNDHRIIKLLLIIVLINFRCSYSNGQLEENWGYLA